MEKLREKVPKILDAISENKKLEVISDSNWKDYRDGMFELLDISDEFGEDNDEFRILRAFFDIYENDDNNNEILLYASKTPSSKLRTSSKEGIELGMLLPNYAPLAENVQKEISKKAIARAIHVPSAITYAKNHATSPNKSAYHYFNRGDCTNFVSQILEVTGVQQAVYDSEYSGWWHKTKKGLLGTTHTQILSQGIWE